MRFVCKEVIKIIKIIWIFCTSLGVKNGLLFSKQTNNAKTPVYVNYFFFNIHLYFIIFT